MEIQASLGKLDAFGDLYWYQYSTLWFCRTLPLRETGQRVQGFSILKLHENLHYLNKKFVCKFLQLSSESPPPQVVSDSTCWAQTMVKGRGESCWARAAAWRPACWRGWGATKSCVQESWSVVMCPLRPLRLLPGASLSWWRQGRVSARVRVWESRWKFEMDSPHWPHLVSSCPEQKSDICHRGAHRLVPTSPGEKEPLPCMMTKPKPTARDSQCSWWEPSPPGSTRACDGWQSESPLCKPHLLPLPSKFPVAPLPQRAPSRTDRDALLAVRRGRQPRLTRLLCTFFPGQDGVLRVKERAQLGTQSKSRKPAPPWSAVCACTHVCSCVCVCVHVWACALACGWVCRPVHPPISSRVF